MGIESWLMYLVLVLVATATPGPAVLFIMTNATLYGWRKAAFAALGNIAGLLCLGVLAVTGLGAIIKTSEAVFTVVKYAGAAYLMCLGVKLLLQKDFNQVTIQRRLNARSVAPGKIFVQALGVAVSNPKAIVFLTALFPQFLIIDKPLVPQFSMLIGTLMIFSFAFLMFYALVAHGAKTWLASPGKVKTFSRISGSLFIGFGFLLATSSHQ